MEADRLAASLRGRTPLASRQHLFLEPLLDKSSASHACKGGGFRIVVHPPDVLPPDPIEVAAVRTGDEVAALVGSEELTLDPGDALNCRCRYEKDLSTRVRRPRGSP